MTALAPLMLACGKDDIIPEPVVTPPVPPVAKKERTIGGHSLHDLENALDFAAKYSDSTYFFNLKKDLEIDSIKLKTLNELAFKFMNRENIKVNPAGFGIYAPNNETQYLYDVWKTPGWPIKTNPENSANPMASLMDYPRFIAAGQKNINEKPSQDTTVDMTADMANRFTEVVDSVLNTVSQDSKIVWNMNDHSVVMDDKTLGLISTPQVNKADARIKLDKAIKIKKLYLESGQYAIGDTLLRTDMHVRNSAAMGVKPTINVHKKPAEDETINLAIAHTPNNVFTITRAYDLGGGHIVIENKDLVLVAVAALPMDYQVRYVSPDGPVQNVYYGLDAQKYSILPDRKLSQYIVEDKMPENMGAITSYLQDGYIIIVNRFANGIAFNYQTDKTLATAPGLAGKSPVSPYTPKTR